MLVTQNRGAAFSGLTIGKGLLGSLWQVAGTWLLSSPNLRSKPLLPWGVLIPRRTALPFPAGATQCWSRELKLNLTSGVGIKAVIEFLSNN